MIKRPLYLQKLIDYQDKLIIKVITGIRRCGKSTLLKSFAKYLESQGVEKNHIIQINFEDLRYDGVDYKTLNQMLLKQFPKDNKKIYILLDEIQRVIGWEKVANSLILNNKIDLYLTGSNAYMLSSELSTYLSGRYIEIKMFPLSFKEFLTFYTFPKDMNKSEKFIFYLRFGGMPSLKDYKFNEAQVIEILDSIYNTVVMKDVVSRDEVKDVTVLQKLIRFLADNTGNITSVNKITQVLVNEKSLLSSNNKLIESYISLLINAFVFYPIKRYDIKGKAYLKSLEKYYIVDTGIRNYLLGNVRDIGRILEGVVFFELIRKGYTVSIGKIADKEIDFIATKYNEKLYIQVSDNIASETTRERELFPLRLVKDSFEKIILTTDTFHLGTTSDGIKIINVIDWLLNN